MPGAVEHRVAAVVGLRLPRLQLHPGEGAVGQLGADGTRVGMSGSSWRSGLSVLDSRHSAKRKGGDLRPTFSTRSHRADPDLAVLVECAVSRRLNRWVRFVQKPDCVEKARHPDVSVARERQRNLPQSFEVDNVGDVLWQGQRPGVDPLHQVRMHRRGEQTSVCTRPVHPPDFTSGIDSDVLPSHISHQLEGPFHGWLRSCEPDLGWTFQPKNNGRTWTGPHGLKHRAMPTRHRVKQTAVFERIDLGASRTVRRSHHPLRVRRNERPEDAVHPPVVNCDRSCV